MGRIVPPSDSCWFGTPEHDFCGNGATSRVLGEKQSHTGVEQLPKHHRTTALVRREETSYVGPERDHMWQKQKRASCSQKPKISHSTARQEEPLFQNLQRGVALTAPSLQPRASRAVRESYSVTGRF